MTAPQAAIAEITYAEAMRRFKPLMRAEGLPPTDAQGCRWFAIEDVAVAALVVTPSLARIKATATAPEWRGYGYGEALLLHLSMVARQEGVPQMEVFARHPAWFERNGWQVQRVTTWGTTVLRKKLSPGC